MYAKIIQSISMGTDLVNYGVGEFSIGKCCQGDLGASVFQGGRALFEVIAALCPLIFGWCCMNENLE